MTSMTVRTADGGRITLSNDGRGGFVGTIERGYRETPEQRKARIAARRGGVHRQRTARSDRRDARAALRSGAWS